MPYIAPFTSIVTTTKRNNRYYGPTESQKMSSFLTEVKTDLTTLFNEFNNVQAQFDSLKDSYFTLGDDPVALYNMKAKVNNILDTINNRIYVQAQNIQPGA